MILTKRIWGHIGEWGEESYKAENLLVLIKENRTAFSPPPELSSLTLLLQIPGFIL